MSNDEARTTSAEMDSAFLQASPTEPSVFFPFGNMPKTQEFFSSCRGGKVPWFLDCCLRGASQVVFQNNPISGIFILAALIVFDYGSAFYGILALVASTATAVAFHSKNYGGYDSFVHGIYGFNGLLVGLGIATFAAFDAENSHTALRYIHTAVVVSLFGFLSSVITNALAKWMSPLPCLTLPFNIAVIWFLGGTLSYTNWNTSETIKPHLALYQEDVRTCFRSEADAECSSAILGFIVGTLRGVCEVWFANSTVSGILMVVGIAFCSPRAAVLAVLGSALGVTTGLALGVDGSQLYSGLWGFNPLLTAMAIGAGPFGKTTVSTFCFGCLGAVFTAFLSGTLGAFLAPVGLPTFTLPFCLVTLPLLGANLHGKDE